MKLLKQKFNKLKMLVRICYNEVREPYFAGMPAQLAFYLFLSITPAMVLASQLFGLFDLTLEEIETWMNIDMNSEAVQALSGMLNTKPTGVNSVFLVIIALWGASKVLFSIAKISNRINTHNSTAGRVFIKDRIIAMGSMIILLLTIVAAIVLLVYAPAVIELALKDKAFTSILSRIWKNLRWFVVISLFCFTIMYVYCTAPKVRPKPQEVAPGAIFAAMGMLLMTGLFNMYVNSSISRSIIYGSLSSIVALLMWFWFISWVICLGAIFNKGWSEMIEETKQLEDKTVDVIDFPLTEPQAGMTRDFIKNSASDSNYVSTDNQEDDIE